MLEVLPAGGGEPPPQLREDRFDALGAGGQRFGTGTEGDEPPVDLGGALRQPLGLGAYGFGVPQDAVGALEGVGDAVASGAFVEPGQFGPELGEPQGEVVGAQPPSRTASSAPLAPRSA